MENEKACCNNCNTELLGDEEYCRMCGTIFIDDVQCHIHNSQPADGICLICSYACCTDCGKFYNNVFLCNEHCQYEIFGSMARVFGCSDAVNVEYMKTALEQEGLHPFIFSRKASPLSLGGVDYSLFRASGEYNGNIINEFKLMVPLNEVLAAEQLITELNSGD